MSKIPEAKDKIILPKNLQREMMQFFLKTSIPKMARANKECRQAQANPDSAAQKDA